MPQKDLDSAQVSDYSGLDAYAIPAMNVDRATSPKETQWSNPNWATYWGWFNQNPKVKNAVVMKAIWNVGKGWTADIHTTNILNLVQGDGKQTFKDILFSLECSRRIGGVGYAEIITHNGKKLSEGGKLVNLRCMDPGNTKEIYDESGMLIRFEETSTVDNNPPRKWDPEEVLYLPINKMVGQIHGISDLEALRKVILADSKNFDDMDKVTHFQAKPFIVFKLKTDDEAKIQAFAQKIRSARNLGEDMFVPDDENLLSYDVVQVVPSQVLMQWRDDIRNEYYRGVGLPQIVPGGSGNGTESEAKVIFAAFEQIVENDIRDIEEAIKRQLKLEIKINRPTMMSDIMGIQEQKNAGNVMNVQPGEMNPMAQNQS